MDHGDDPFSHYWCTSRAHAPRREETLSSTQPELLPRVGHSLPQSLGRYMASSDSAFREERRSSGGPPGSSRGALRRGFHDKKGLAKRIVVADNKEKRSRVLPTVQFVPTIGATDGAITDATSADSSVGPISKMGFGFCGPFQTTRDPYWK